MKKKTLLIGITAMIFVIMAACSNASNNGAEIENSSEEDPKEQAISDFDKNKAVEENKFEKVHKQASVSEDKNNNNNNKESNSNGSSGTAREDSDKSTLVEKNQNSSSDNIQNEEKTNIIPSGEKAIEFLKKELDMENNEDIIFDDMGGTLEEDSSGFYYTITLYSKSLQEAGGSGTLESYKVYQDGRYKLN